MCFVYLESNLYISIWNTHIWRLFSIYFELCNTLLHWNWKLKGNWKLNGKNENSAGDGGGGGGGGGSGGAVIWGDGKKPN